MQPADSEPAEPLGRWADFPQMPRNDLMASRHAARATAWLQSFGKSFYHPLC
jgi:hypothetical protein